MSEHITHTPQVKRLERTPNDKIVAGVAGGLGRYFDLSPTVFRLGLVVLTLLGGAGILVYLAAVLVIPQEGSEQSIAEKVLAERRDRPWPLVGLGIVAVAARRPRLPGRRLARRGRRLGARPDRRARRPLGEPRRQGPPRPRRGAGDDRPAPGRCRDLRRRSRSRGSTSASTTASATTRTRPGTRERAADLQPRRRRPAHRPLAGRARHAPDAGERLGRRRPSSA